MNRMDIHCQLGSFNLVLQQYRYNRIYPSQCMGFIIQCSIIPRIGYNIGLPVLRLDTCSESETQNLDIPINIRFTLTASPRPETSEIFSYLHWSDSMTFTHNQESMANLNTTYFISLSSESNQSNYTTSNTSILLPLFYDEDYNISVVARNCTGESEPAEPYVTWDG